MLHPRVPLRNIHDYMELPDAPHRFQHVHRHHAARAGGAKATPFLDRPWLWCRRSGIHCVRFHFLMALLMSGGRQDCFHKGRCLIRWCQTVGRVFLHPLTLVTQSRRRSTWLQIWPRCTGFLLPCMQTSYIANTLNCHLPSRTPWSLAAGLSGVPGKQTQVNRRGSLSQVWPKSLEHFLGILNKCLFWPACS